MTLARTRKARVTPMRWCFFFVKNYLIYFYRRDLTWIYFGNNLKDKNTHRYIYKHEHIIIIIKKKIINFL